MSKMSELSQVLDDLITCGENMIRTANSIKAIFTNEEKETEAPNTEATTPVATNEPEPEKTYSFTDVRKAFSAKSHEGFTAEVKELIAKYGADRLSGVDPSKYTSLMKDLEVIGNG